jgi:hypothetical protein
LGVATLSAVYRLANRVAACGVLHRLGLFVWAKRDGR